MPLDNSSDCRRPLPSINVLTKAWRLALLLLLIVPLESCIVFFNSDAKPSSADIAKSFRNEGKVDQAVEAYLKHIDARLADKNRDDKENPYFYYVLIGDTYRESDRLDDALKYYGLAIDKSVRKELLGDRYRLIAKALEEKGDYQSAFSILTQFRELDPLSFDLAIDFMHRRYIRKEQIRRKTKSPE